MSQLKPAKLIGVYKADGGFIGEAKYFFGHLLGLTSCELCSVTHSPVRKKPAWKAMTQNLKKEFGVDFELVHLNERTEAVKKASQNKEPCVLAEMEDGSLTLLIDKQDLGAIAGSVERFERALRGRLMLFF